MKNEERGTPAPLPGPPPRGGRILVLRSSFGYGFADAPLPGPELCDRGGGPAVGGRVAPCGQEPEAGGRIAGRPLRRDRRRVGGRSRPHGRGADRRPGGGGAARR